MNSVTAQNKNDLNVIFPDKRTVTFVRKGSTVQESVDIYPMPLQMWKQGFKYIAQIAPLLGFDLSEVAETAQKQVEGDDTPLPDDEIDTGKLLQALQGDGSDLILEFVAYAIEELNEDGTPNVKFFHGMYDEIVDILAAVIEVNLNFFVQKLLPKVVTRTREVVTVTQNVRTGLNKA